MTKDMIFLEEQADLTKEAIFVDIFVNENEWLIILYKDLSLSIFNLKQKEILKKQYLIETLKEDIKYEDKYPIIKSPMKYKSKKFYI